MNLLVVRLRIKLEEDLGPAKYLSSIVDFFQAMLEILTQLCLAGQVHRERDSSEFVPGELLVVVEQSQGRLSLLLVHEDKSRGRLLFAGFLFPRRLRFQPPLSLRDVAGDLAVGVAARCRVGPRRSCLYAAAECYVKLRGCGRRPRRRNASLVAWALAGAVR